MKVAIFFAMSSLWVLYDSLLHDDPPAGYQLPCLYLLPTCFSSYMCTLSNPHLHRADLISSLPAVYSFARSTGKQVSQYWVVVLIAGLITSLLGTGTGTVVGPFFLLVGMTPEVGSRRSVKGYLVKVSGHFFVLALFLT